MEFELAGGWVVLCGPGMFVNRALAVGIGTPMTAADFDELEQRCEEVGVAPTIEVTASTDETTRNLAARRGYTESSRVQALRRTLSDSGECEGRSAVWSVEPVGERLAEWQRVSAAGWHHADGSAARRASDAFARAMSHLDPDSLLLAVDPVDGRSVGCASLSRRGSVATLGAMTTMPAERGRGVQGSMLAERVEQAGRAGCRLATTTTVRGSASERNLVRAGFERWFEVSILTAPPRR